jgi:hypothetical protein
MFLWHWCLDSNNEIVEEIFVGYTQILKVSPRDYNLLNKGAVASTLMASNTIHSPRRIIPSIVSQELSNPT